MRVYVLADSSARLAALSTMLAEHCALTAELLGRASIGERDIDATVVAADLSIVDNISALKAVSAKRTRVAKRIFLIDRKGRLSVVQAYALGATHVLANPVSGKQLLAKLANDVGKSR
jgi:DNA-binding response OmpR family regulator